MINFNKVSFYGNGDYQCPGCDNSTKPYYEGERQKFCSDLGLNPDASWMEIAYAKHEVREGRPVPEICDCELDIEA